MLKSIVQKSINNLKITAEECEYIYNSLLYAKDKNKYYQILNKHFKQNKTYEIYHKTKPIFALLK